VTSGAEHAAAYSGADVVTRFSVTAAGVEEDALSPAALTRWVDGCDPVTGEQRGRELTSPDADLLLDGTMNMPKSFSLAVLLVPDLRPALEVLQDQIRDRALALWRTELNARRGAGGLRRESIARLEVVELRHERSRALDPHVHRHLWLGVKVLGEDGKWSNVDSRVAMRLHTVVNAWGDLAAATDPAWIAALTDHGLALDADGEVAQLAHLVRPLSRRSNQIEANRARLLAEWRGKHPGHRPDAVTLARIDRLAWAQHRPAKLAPVNIGDWAKAVRTEIQAAAAAAPRTSPRDVTRTTIGGADRDLLASIAVVEADGRASGSAGRFSRHDVRAGVIRAVARSGVVADASVLEELVEDVSARALRLPINLLAGKSDVPAHVKGLVSRTALQDKQDLAGRSARLGTGGGDLAPSSFPLLAQPDEPASRLGPAQLQAACAIAGHSALVTVTGPAGTGKTTLLRGAQRALAAQQRRMLVVAPTRKAAVVAGTEVGTPASSVHALLHDHGYRFGRDAAGQQAWTRIRAGNSDPLTGGPYPGPRVTLRSGDRIVVDEAGMLDLPTANALTELALENGVGLALVGDPLQAAPVGHSGAMEIMRRHSGSVIELTAPHRFRDPAFAALSLKLREPPNREAAISVARELVSTGRLRLARDDVEAREQMVQAWVRHTTAGERVALVVHSNAEAQSISDRIQQERIDSGDLNERRVAMGQHQQRLLVGDLIQTRRNDRVLDVDNRAIWAITGIDDRGVRLASATDSSHVRAVSHEYASEYAHLAYASTVHGVQGETADVSIVGPGVNAAGLYVGMTRGRDSNNVIVVAQNEVEAVSELADTMARGRPELTIAELQGAATQDLRRAALTTAAVHVAEWLAEATADSVVQEGRAVVL
jgi:energy-coupling factor transporter ATP-binding protein EcfA2